MSVLLYGDEALRVQATTIENIGQEHVDVSRQLIETMFEENGLGVAANQIGSPWSMCVYLENDQPKTILNPLLVSSSEESWYFEEGCLSLPGITFGFFRPKNVRVHGVDLDGNELDLEPTDPLMSRVLQHELDHLQGVLVLDRVSRQQRREAERRMIKIRKLHASSK